MKKKNILLLIPLIVITGFIIYSWSIILITNIVATWRHYSALALFGGLVFLFFKNFKQSVVFTCIYLILATCNLLALTPSIETSSFGIQIGSLQLSTPTFQILPFWILMLFFILNFDALINIYLDYKEAKKNK
jgi:hypothetical protein